MHKWFSVVAGLLLLLWAFSGIVLNHRKIVSAVDVPRTWLPPNYTPENWNLASIRSALPYGDGWLVWGNIGIWQTDSSFRQWRPLMDGLPAGMDNRRTMRIIRTSGDLLLAATQSGLFMQSADGLWQQIALPLQDERMMDVSEAEGKVYVVSRSDIFMATSAEIPLNFERLLLPAASDEDGKTSLFRTLWVLHSGEVLGIAGKLVVDIFGLLLIFFVITGYIYFFFPGLIRLIRKRGMRATGLINTNRFSIRWHNKLGLWLGGFLVFTALTGMFLRPPLLIPIAQYRVTKLKGTILNHPNTWHDKLRALRYDAVAGYYLIATNEGLYYSHHLASEAPKPFTVQPPISVMGINVLEMLENGNWLIGSFNGLYEWNPSTGLLADYLTGEPQLQRPDVSSPISNNMISGIIRKEKADLIFDYNRGLMHADLNMPDILSAQPMPLWNLALEIHTGRIFQHYIGPFYLLLVPLTGLIALLILISGIVVYISMLIKKRSK